MKFSFFYICIIIISSIRNNVIYVTTQIHMMAYMISVMFQVAYISKNQCIL